MRIKKLKRKHITLDPGEHYVSNQNVVISTILGSCVAACLYDPLQKVVGMNHFLLTSKGYDEDAPICDTEPGRYGICAMDLLIDEMIKQGATPKHLHAKVFGGSSMFKPFDECRLGPFCVGDINGMFIREFLKNAGIKLIAEDLGGDTGRRIHFFSDDFSVYVKKMTNIKISKLIQRDETLWEKTLEAQEHPM